MVRLSFILLVAVVLRTTLIAADDANLYWPQWRGPMGTGISLTANPPVEWSEEKNIRWKIKLPGKGHSTPVIWKDVIYLTAAFPYGEAVPPVRNEAEGAHDNFTVSQHHEFVAMAIDRRSGKVTWQRTLKKAFPHEGGHYTGSLASHSPATDGQHLYVSFGSQGIYCLDLEGKVVWRKELGEMQTRHAHGEGSSPALHGGHLIVNWDHEGQSFVVALDAKTGKERWRNKREEMTSWSSPIVVEHGGGAQVVVSATKRVRSYDLKSGRLIWECGGLSRNVVASPVAGNGMVYFGNSYDHQAMMGVRLSGAKGDITGSSHVVWTLNRLTPYVPSPLLYGKTLYFLRHNQGVLSCLNAMTGEHRSGPYRLDGIRQVFASPVGAGGRVYIVDREGIGLVLTHGASVEPLGVNRLNDSFSASPAMVGEELYLRGEEFLYCIARTGAN